MEQCHTYIHDMLTAKAHAGWVDESSKQNGVNSRANLGGTLTVEVLSASANVIALWHYVPTQQTDPTDRCMLQHVCAATSIVTSLYRGHGSVVQVHTYY